MKENKMGIKTVSFMITGLVLSTSVNAAIITQGFLTTNDDGNTNIITDSLNNVEYLRFDVLADLNYDQTLAVLGTQDGGGWTIASHTVAIDFVSALFSSSALCSHDGFSAVSTSCGTLSGWYDGKLGASYDAGNDGLWFLDLNGEADYVWIDADGTTNLFESTLADSDLFSAGGTFSSKPISWLVSRPSEVPIPAAVWLFGSGLLSLIGVARRKIHA